MQKKLVIFDLDGTLTNTLRSIWKTANLTLEYFGYEPYDLDSYRYFVGNGSYELIRKCLLGRGQTDEAVIQKVLDKYQEFFETYCSYEVKPYDGIIELLNILKQRGMKLAVNSNKPQDRTVDVIREFFGDDLFDCIVGQSDERERKPAPDGVFYILDQLGISKEETVYIGDTCTDMMTGKSAGVYTVGALWGFRDRQELEENHADVIISHPLELTKVIDGFIINNR